MDKVSVIMSTYKEPIEWIQQSVDSILNQTYKNLEFIIIVDNPEYVELVSLLNDYADSDDRISVVVNNNNIGLVKSLNKALSFCTGEYVARMDADDVSLPERFQKEVEFLDTHKEYDFVSTPMILYDEHGDWGCD